MTQIGLPGEVMSNLPKHSPGDLYPLHAIIIRGILRFSYHVQRRRHATLHSQTFKSAILSATLLVDGVLSFGPPGGAPSVFGLGLAFTEVESFGKSFVYGRNSGAPGMYFRSGRGTSIP